MFDWAKYQRTKGAVKLHLVLDHDGYLPCFGVVTDGTVHDVKVAQQLRFAPGTIVVDDRGYNDYRLFGRWCATDMMFAPVVTRLITYGVAVPPFAGLYMKAVLSQPDVAEWIDKAQDEPWVIEKYEAEAEAAA